MSRDHPCLARGVPAPPIHPASKASVCQREVSGEKTGLKENPCGLPYIRTSILTEGFSDLPAGLLFGVPVSLYTTAQRRRRASTACFYRSLRCWTCCLRWKWRRRITDGTTPQCFRAVDRNISVTPEHMRNRASEYERHKRHFTQNGVQLTAVVEGLTYTGTIDTQTGNFTITASESQGGVSIIEVISGQFSSNSRFTSQSQATLTDGVDSCVVRSSDDGRRQ